MVLTPLITTTDTKETGEMVKGRYDVWIRLPDPSSLQDSNGWMRRPRVYTSCIGWRSESVCFFIATSLWHYPRHCQERRSIDSKKIWVKFSEIRCKIVVLRRSFWQYSSLTSISLREREWSRSPKTVHIKSSPSSFRVSGTIFGKHWVFCWSLCRKCNCCAVKFPHLILFPVVQWKMDRQK